MNFGMIGLGHIANKFADTINKMGECLYAVAAKDLARAKAFSEKYKSVKYYGSYEEIYNDPRVECIYIATPNSFHYQNAKDCLLHHKHVICEKPFTINPREAEELYNFARDRKLFIMEALWPEFFPSTKKLIEIIKSGTIGEIKEIKVTYGSYKDKDIKKRLSDITLGGGALLDIGIYPLGFIDSILDDEVLSFTEQHTISEYGTDDSSHIHLYYKNNIHAEAYITFNEELKREAYIIGSKGFIYIPNHHQNEGFIVKGDKEIEYSFPFKINGFEYQIEEAIECISNNRVEAISYPKEKSLRLSRLLYNIRMSFGVKYSLE